MKALTLNRKIAPASPAIAEDNSTAIHWYLITEIPCASTALGFSPTALNLNPVFVLLTTKKMMIAISKTTPNKIKLLPNNDGPIGKQE